MALEAESILTPEEAFPRAKEAAIKAVELDENLADAHLALAAVRMSYEWDWPGAEREIKRALELDPNSVAAHRAYESYLDIIGKQQEAFAELEKIKALDPLLPPWTFVVHHWRARDYDRGIELARVWVEAEPNNANAHGWLAWPYTQKGMYKEAIAEFHEAVRLERSDVPGIKGSLAYAYAVSGRNAKARKILHELLELSKQSYVRPYYVAIIYTALGEKDSAIGWLEKAYKGRCAHMTALKRDPWLDPLRSDPRFQDLLRRMNFPP
jgi:tetratricopeptide (TPR) repeat protein